MSAVGRSGGAVALPLEAHLAALASLRDVGPARLRWLLAHGTPAHVWGELRSGRLGAVGPVGPLPGRSADDPNGRQQVEAWCRQSHEIDPREIWRRCEHHGIGVVALGSAAYPVALAQDPDPPTVVFHLGDPDRLVHPRVAIVGTRRATGYGLRTARQLGQELAAAGVSVVSGLALGVDAAAHQGALLAGGAPAVAVVAAGLDAPCPVRNRALAHDVARTGLVLSELPPGVAASPWRFPVRNRIIAALAHAVVVVESAGAGGSMHTVREAMDRDRPVLAVPGPIDSRASEGTNELISDGALVCGGVADVLAAIGHVGPREPGSSVDARPEDLRPVPTGEAAAVLEGLSWRPATVEQLAARAGLDFGAVTAALGVLERDGWVRHSSGWVERVARVPGVGGGTA